MSNLFAQLVLARRGPDDGWMNILVVVVMAVIWIIGGIVKAMKTNAGDKQKSSRTPSRRPPAHGRTGQQHMPARPQRPVGPAQRSAQPRAEAKKRTTLTDLREAARRFATEAEQAFQPQTTKPKPSRPKPVPKRPSGPKIAGAPQPLAEPVLPMRKQSDDRRAAAKEVAPRQQLSDLLSDYRDLRD
ncbi:MAG: hypothetical protein ACYS14_14890 [Planctomycetota bacterium]